MRTRPGILQAGVALLALLAVHDAAAQARIVEDVVASEQRGYVSVSLLFSCTLRYASHTPATEGDVVQVRLSAGADCGSGDMAEHQPLLGGAAGYVRSIETVRPYGSEVQVRIGWTRPESFVVTPSMDGRVLRIRLLRPETPRVTVKETATAAYAVNLASSTSPYTAEAQAAAAQVVGVSTYVSETAVDEQRWYRLRAGPFFSEVDARRALANARRAYPKAWLAVADESVLNATGLSTVVTAVPTTVPRPNASKTPEDVRRTFDRARQAFRRKDYATAIPLLAELTRQPEFPQRAQAQEMLGLARERSGQVAHAKAEYEDYLARYPDGDGASRVRKRLQALAWAMRPRGGGGLVGKADESPWRAYGGVAQSYRRDQSKVERGDFVSDLTTQDALLTDVSLVARRHGDRFDFVTRASAGYAYDLLPDGPGNETRVSTLFAELADQVAGWYARLGRQNGGTGASLGTFDGVQAGWQLWPRLRVNGFFGFPVDSTRAGPDSNRRFAGLSADLGTFAEAWDVSLYAVTQQIHGLTDRQAVGSEVRYFRPGVSVVGLVDFDVHYSALNSAMLLGTFTLPARWTLNFNLDRRKSPGLGTRNALIGQPVGKFDELFGLYTQAQIERLAEDRTADSETYSVGVSRPFGERWQWSLDAATTSLGATPASGGVPATVESGRDSAISTQLLGYGLFGRGDVTSLGLQYQTGDTQEMVSLGLGAQLPIGQRWRIGPRLRLDRRTLEDGDSTTMTWSPTVRAELRGKRLTLELEGGAEIGSRDFASQTEDSARHFFSLGYRYDFR
jgi:hypothetical protein